jgi:hypothetical protein
VKYMRIYTELILGYEHTWPRRRFCVGHTEFYLATGFVYCESIK